jgi:hypothetical protein
LESTARELMTASALMRTAELRDQLCQAETVERAGNALKAATANVRNALQKAREPATVADICEGIEGLIQSIPHGEPTEGYSAALTLDVGSLQPSRGGLEIACRKLRTTCMRRPTIPDVLAAVREGIAVYEAARRALEELPSLIVRAQKRQRTI